MLIFFLIVFSVIVCIIIWGIVLNHYHYLNDNDDFKKRILVLDTRLSILNSIESKKSFKEIYNRFKDCDDEFLLKIILMIYLEDKYCSEYQTCCNLEKLIEDPIEELKKLPENAVDFCKIFNICLEQQQEDIKKSESFINI